MVDRQTTSALLCMTVGFGCIGSVFWGQGSNQRDPSPPTVVVGAGPAAAQIPAAPTPSARQSPAAPTTADAEQGIDRSIETGAIGHDSALRRPNPSAYAELGKDHSPPSLTGAEAVNYLAGNTLKFEDLGKGPHYRFFASRGLQGDGTDASFIASAWDRNSPDLCEIEVDGTSTCRPLTIVLDGQYEFPGARLGTVTIGSTTAVLLKGNVAKFPDYVPVLDRPEQAETPTPASKAPPSGSAGWAGLIGHTATVDDGTPPDSHRRTVYYAADNRILDLDVMPGTAERQTAVKVTVGHWHVSKTGVCLTSIVSGAMQTCFKPVSSGLDVLKLNPIGRSGTAQTVTVLKDASVGDLARD